MKLKVRKLGKWQTALGLIGKANPEAIFFQTRFGIHTFGLRFPIDVVLLDDSFRIAIIKQNLKPNRIFIWNPKYKNVLELPAKLYKRIKVGDKISLLHSF